MFIASGVAVSKAATEAGSKMHRQHTAKSKSRVLLRMGICHGDRRLGGLGKTRGMSLGHAAEERFVHGSFVFVVSCLLLVCVHTREIVRT